MMRPLFLFILLVLLSACDSTVKSDLPTGSNLPAGEFAAHVEGDLSRSISGEAIFETLRGLTGEPVYWLRLRDSEGTTYERRFRIIDFGSVREDSPDRGVYDLPAYSQYSNGNRGDFSVTYRDSDVSESGLPVFKSLGGTLKIYGSNETHVEGSFHFEAYDSVAVGSGNYERFEIKVSGEFHAAKGNVGVVLN